MKFSIGISLLLTTIVGAQDSLSLSQAMLLAESGSPSVQRASALREAAQATTDGARGALWPTIGLTSDLTTLGPGTSSNPATRLDSDAQWRTALGARWTFWDGMRSWHGLTSLQAREEAAIAAERDAKQTARMEAARAWAEVARAQEQLAARRSVLDVSRVRSAIARRRMALGAVSGLEAGQARVDLSRDSLAVLRQEDVLAQAVRTLGLVLGKSLTKNVKVGAIPVGDSVELAVPASIDPPALQQVRALEQAAQAEARVANGSWWPELSLSAQYVALDQIDFAPGHTWNQGTVLGAQASWNLFEGGRTLARRRAALALREQALATLRERERTTIADLEQAQRRLATARRAVELERENDLQAQSVLDAALAQFEGGTLSGLDLRRYQDSRLQASLQVSETRLELLLATLALKKSLGQELSIP